MNISCLYTSNSPTKNSIHINPRMKKMSTICSNPLMKNTKVCSVFWYEVNKFNTKIFDMEYEINRSFNQVQNEHISEQTYSFFDKNIDCEDDYFSTQECKIYDS